MATQRTSVLISYNDNNLISQNRDNALAIQLANYLRENGIDAEIKSYSTSMLNTSTHQWLILIPSPEIVNSDSMNRNINTALDQVIKRRMKGVLAVTAGSSDLPAPWTTIRKYDASDPREENVALQGILRAMQYAKVPYTEAKTLVQTQQAQQAAATRQQKVAQKRRILVTAAALFLIVALLLGAFYTADPAIIQGILPASKLTALLQTHAHATQTALAEAKTPSSSPTVAPTVQAMQHQYDSITKKIPTITGFQQSQQWSVTSTDTTSCKFDANHPSNYHAAIQTNNEYIRCMATNTKFKNFALQITMNITGDAGGVIFRDDGNGKYYRFAFNQSVKTTPDADTYSVYRCNSECDINAASINIGSIDTGLLLPDINSTVNVDRNKPITFTVIVQGSNIDLYSNKTFLTRISATTSTTSASLSGQIGVFAASLGNPTDVTFSNLKVWSLDKSQTK